MRFKRRTNARPRGWPRYAAWPSLGPVSQAPKGTIPRSFTLFGGCNPPRYEVDWCPTASGGLWASAARSGMCLRKDRKGSSMGFRRRTRRRALIAGAVAGGAIAHHEAKQAGQQQPPYDDQAAADDYQDQAAADDQPAGDDYKEPAQYAPSPADPADEIEHLAQLHASGVLTDDEFTAAKAKILGS